MEDYTVRPSGTYRRFHLLFLGVGLFLALITTAEANIYFFTKVMQNCQHYKLSGDRIQMNMDGVGTDNPTFNLTLSSRRNNFEEVLVYGYLSTGYAISRTGVNVKTVNITVIIPSAGDETKVTRADASLLADLVSEKIDPYEFLREIEWVVD
ncbi:hypothetical protein ACFL6Q_01640 [Candidatus Neomarinimicrobiota bacterium]